MRKLMVIVAAASIVTAAPAAVATAQVTGIRHSDGSWTFVDANGRDIHKNRDAGRGGRYANGGAHRDLAHTRGHTSRHDSEDHKVTGGYLPWLSR
jgi:hypothetical protein